MDGLLCLHHRRHLFMQVTSRPPFLDPIHFSVHFTVGSSSNVSVKGRIGKKTEIVHLRCAATTNVPLSSRKGKVGFGGSTPAAPVFHFFLHRDIPILLFILNLHLPRLTCIHNYIPTTNTANNPHSPSPPHHLL